MSPEAQRIAIAEACGWVPYSQEKNPSFWFPPSASRGMHELHRTRMLPDYLHDLNAIHEAEKRLLGDNWGDYYRALGMRQQQYAEERAIFSTAAQRAEALIEVLRLKVE